MNKKARSWLVWCTALVLALGASYAHAAFHLFKIQQIYSNADGTVQFVVLKSIFENEHRWEGHYISGAGTYVFPHDLPSADTAGKSVLIATQGFADLGIIAPDYIVPNHFFWTEAGTVDFGGVDSITYSAGQLPLDGANALLRSGATGKNLATNFAGASASVALGPPAFGNYQGLWWKAPANSESGWGLNLAHQGDTVFASWFTYDTNGKGWWLVMTALKTGANTYSGKLYTTRGPAFNAALFDPAAVVPTETGTGTLTFTDANNGTFNYVIGSFNQTKTITRQTFGPLPTCTFGTVTDLATAVNFQDLWWKKPAMSESGWGINLNHQGDTIFATWFTYDLDGSPLWLVVSAPKTGPGVYSGDLYRTAGPAFSAVPFDSTKVVPTKVGTATFTFADGNNATFAYTVQLAGMGSPVTQSKAITREIFTAPGTTCR
jgi:hypothetical protein